MLSYRAGQAGGIAIDVALGVKAIASAIRAAPRALRATTQAGSTLLDTTKTILRRGGGTSTAAEAGSSLDEFWRLSNVGRVRTGTTVPESFDIATAGQNSQSIPTLPSIWPSMRGGREPLRQ
jgi:hypothetical protein